MKKRDIWLLVVIAIGALAALWLSIGRGCSTAEGKASEITIRNLTDGAVRYRIRALSSSGSEVNKVLVSGALHRFASKVPVDVSYERLGGDVTRRLDPSKPYTFRYDENNLVHLYAGSHGREDAVDLAPYVATPQEIVEKMLELADLIPGDILYDIGCGDGRIVITAAERYGVRAVGIDIVEERIRESKKNARLAGVENRVEFLQGDATTMDISEATVVMLYLLPESNDVLQPQLEAQLTQGSRVVSHNYRISKWKDRGVAAKSMTDRSGVSHSIFVYRR
jgi:precorrin-6B methylase 2